MENVDITNKVKNFIKFGLVGLLILSGAIGYGMFRHYHAENILQIENAKVTSNMISIHALTNGKIKELPFSDGDEVKAGDVIAKIEVNITEEEIKQLQQAVDLAKRNYDSLKLGQRVRTPVRRTKPATTPAPSTSARRNTASVATLEERAKRMDELYEMGAVSKGERDKAHADLQKARSGASSTPAPSTNQTVEIDFVESIQPTPPSILQNAENALKEAELALNVAVEQSKQTEITAPTDGVIYYSFAVDEEMKAGDIIAKIGDDKNVWIEAEVTEDIFNQVALGKKVSYSIEGHNLAGTVTEKIAPQPPEPEKLEEVTAETETTPDAEKTAETATAEQNSQPAETSTEKNSPPPEQVTPEPTAEENKSEVAEEKTAEEVPAEPEKYLLKVSIPADRDFELKLLAETTLKISL